MSAALEAAFGRPVTALALLWKLTRGDGVVLGFTSHDRDLAIGGVVYVARPGMTPSAVRLSADFAADSMDVEGVLDTAAITAGDLDCGRWSGARLELFVVDWSAPELGLLRLMRGQLGDVTRDFGMGASGFRVELLSDMAALAGRGAPRCAPLCRAELGDGRCGVAMEGRRLDVLAGDASGAAVTLQAPLAQPGDWSHGRMRLLSGPLAGVERRIADAEADRLLLEEPLFAAGVSGARLRLWQGCDKRLETCGDRFANAAWFDGEPHVPGTDALLRYGEP